MRLTVVEEEFGIALDEDAEPWLSTGTGRWRRLVEWEERGCDGPAIREARELRGRADLLEEQL